MEKIVFVSHDIHSTLNIKRIEEFIAHGFDIDVYGFNRDGGLQKEYPYKYEIIGSFDNLKSYVSRVSIYINGMLRIKRKYRDEKVIYYLSGQDTAFYGWLLGFKNYIFQEADLTHTYMRLSVIRLLLDCIFKRIIKKSVLTIFTSEGFPQYHFGNKEKWPTNIDFITNRLNRNILDCRYIPKQPIDINCLRIGFVGSVRFKSVASFAQNFAIVNPKAQMHFYGSINSNDAEAFERLKAIDNIYFHGAFKNPDDLYSIYSEIDLVLSTYDVNSANVRYAEPNKFYESIYFETPIIVSKGTFLADKVKHFGIGYEVDPLDFNDINKLIGSITIEDFNKKREAILQIDKKYCINQNDRFFERLSNVCKCK